MKCLLCKKEITSGHCGPNNAGEIEVSFNYGSIHDQLGYCSMPNDNTRLLTLLKSELIKAYICDDCFEQNVDLFEGYNVVRPPKEFVLTTKD